MMVRCTLLTDGSSDECLIPIIQWAFRNLQLQNYPIVELADLRQQRPGHDLEARIQAAIECYSCDLLLIHRDDENQGLEMRISQIDSLMARILPHVPHVPIVPVTMSEAWLLIDESAIRIAAGNPNGPMPLSLPRVENIEGTRDPKSVLFDLLSEASGLRKRARDKFRPEGRRRAVADNITDFSPLMRLAAFNSFYARLESALALLNALH